MGKFPREKIFLAISGDSAAIEEVIQLYEGYINKMAAFHLIDTDGHPYWIISEDVKQELREKLIKALPKWKGLRT